MTRRIQYRYRPCDICCGTDLEELLSYSFTASTRSAQWLWDVRNVVCRACGFAFVSPSPVEESLGEYYADCHTPWSGQTPDYSIAHRISFLLRHIPRDRRPIFVEVGGGFNAEFESALDEHVDHVASVQVNAACDTPSRSLADLPPGSADVLAAYFVLEHFAEPSVFLEGCRRGLRDGGILIVEVPNLYRYPSEPAGLGWWEHTSHFSPRSLAQLAEKSGLRLVDLNSSTCSRPFGFAAAFVSVACDERGSPAAIDEYQLAKACIEEGRALIVDYQTRLAQVRSRVSSTSRNGRHVVIWAANKICKDLLEDFQPPNGVLFVDSNPEKKEFLAPLHVRQPSDINHECFEELKLLVINSRRHAPKIVATVEKLSGRAIDPSNVVISEPAW